MQDDEITSSLSVKPVLPLQVHDILHQAATMDEISQYYVLPEKHNQLDFIVYNPPEAAAILNPELLLSANLVRYKPFFQSELLGRPVLTHWDLHLLENLLEDYNDKLVVDFLRYRWPMSRSILPLTKHSAKVNNKGAIDFPEAINQYLATEHSNNTLLGPFC